MGDRAEVSHQLRTSDDHALRLGCWEDGGYTRRQTASAGLGPVRLLRRPRTSGAGPLVCADGRPVVVGRVECRSPEMWRAGASGGDGGAQEDEAQCPLGGVGDELVGAGDGLGQVHGDRDDAHDGVDPGGVDGLGSLTE